MIHNKIAALSIVPMIVGTAIIFTSDQADKGFIVMGTAFIMLAIASFLRTRWKRKMKRMTTKGYVPE